MGKRKLSPPPVEKSLLNEVVAYAAELGIKAAASEIENDVSGNSLPSEPERKSRKKSGSITSKTTGTASKLADISKESKSSFQTKPRTPNRLIFEARPDWHAAPLASLPQHEVENPEMYNDTIANIKLHAMKLLETDSLLYASKHLSSSSSQKFLSTVMTSGTLSDKVSALTLVIQESPVHTTKSFESLLGLAKKRSRCQAVIALAALKDLLGTGAVLPSTRRLRTFTNQPGLLATLHQDSVRSWRPDQKLPGDISEAHLISWAYEDWLKQSYFEMLKIIENWCNDEVEYARSRVVTYVYELLRDKPEQEVNLLRLLVNKLGDPDKKIASRTSFLILQLQTSHPLLKSIIIRSIESEILLRPGQSRHAIYYAITTLNQTILSLKETEIAKKLLSVYFELFVFILKNPNSKKSTHVPTEVVNRNGEIQGGGGLVGKRSKAKKSMEQQTKAHNEEIVQKIISAILTGVNRAFPFSKSDDITLEGHMETLFKVTHSSNFNTSIQALLLIEQLATSKNLSVDRFYRTLYESLLDPRLIHSSKHTLYLNLLYRSLRSDINVTRVKAFAKRMVQIITLHQPPFICGILYLLKEIQDKFPGLRNLIIEPEHDESEEEIYYDVSEGENPVRSQETNRKSRLAPRYDGRKRDPRHSNVNNCCLWELIPFTAHFHPSVSIFATRLQTGEKMPPKPDLSSHTLTSFLDRFVYRNAKAVTSKPKGNSIMQPLAGGESKSVLLSHKATSSNQQPLNSESFWRKKVGEVAADEVFFHKYFNQIGNSKQLAKKHSLKELIQGNKAGHEDNDEGEDEIWQALVRSKPDIEGQDSDSEVLDFEDSLSESSFGEIITNETLKDNSIISQSDDDDDDDCVGDEEELSGDDEVTKINNLGHPELRPVVQEQSEATEKTSKKKRTRIKNLPTFASVDDYAEILDNEQNEDF